MTIDPDRYSGYYPVSTFKYTHWPLYEVHANTLFILYFYKAYTFSVFVDTVIKLITLLFINEEVMGGVVLEFSILKGVFLENKKTPFNIRYLIDWYRDVGSLNDSKNS